MSRVWFQSLGASLNTIKADPPDGRPLAPPIRRLLNLIGVCKASIDEIITDDHAAMDEIEQNLANAEAAARRLLANLAQGGDDPTSGVVDIDDF